MEVSSWPHPLSQGGPCPAPWGRGEGGRPDDLNHLLGHCSLLLRENTCSKPEALLSQSAETENSDMIAFLHSIPFSLSSLVPFGTVSSGIISSVLLASEAMSE